jgi:hypothetical protein
MCVFKEYRYIFGKEGEGIHSYRLFNIAVMDVLSTVVGAFLFSYIFKINYFISLAFLFLLGILLHYLFCVETTVNMYIYSFFK